jgi:hypothetical protein
MTSHALPMLPIILVLAAACHREDGQRAEPNRAAARGGGPGSAAPARDRLWLRRYSAQGGQFYADI